MPPNNSQYDFILKGDQQPAPQQLQPDGSPKKFFLPKKAILVAVGVLFLLVIGLVVFSSLSKDSGPSDQLVAVMGTAQEISRVSDLVSKSSRDIGTLGLASTTSTATASEASQFAAYAAKAGIKYDAKKLALYHDSKIDTDLATAEQNNTVEQTYYDYLKVELVKYENHLKALSITKSKTLLELVTESYNSTQNLLASTELK